MKSTTAPTPSMKSGESSLVWNSPLPRVIGLLRRSGQHFCADQCQELYDLLHEWDPSQRLETSILKSLIEAARVSSTPSPTMDSAESYVDPAQMSLEL